MPFGTQSYSLFQNELNLGSVNNLRFLTAYHPSPDDVQGKFTSNQADLVYTINLTQFFPTNFVFDDTQFRFEVIVVPNQFVTAVGANATIGSTTYPFFDYSARKPSAHSITGTTLTVTKSTYDLFAGTDVVARAAAFCTEANALPGVSGCGSTNLPASRFEYEDAVFNVFLIGV